MLLCNCCILVKSKPLLHWESLQQHYCLMILNYKQPPILTQHLPYQINNGTFIFIRKQDGSLWLFIWRKKSIHTTCPERTLAESSWIHLRRCCQALPAWNLIEERHRFAEVARQKQRLPPGRVHGSKGKLFQFPLEKSMTQREDGS